MTRASKVAWRAGLRELSAVTGAALPQDDVDVHARMQTVALSTRFRAAEGASAALAASALVARDLARDRGSEAGPVSVASRHAEASLQSFMHLQFADAERAPALRIAPEHRTAAAGFYPTADGRWIYLHSGFPHNTAGLLKLLGTPDDRAAVADAVAARPAADLEADIAAAGLCGAMVRSPQEWDSSDDGQLLGAPARWSTSCRLAIRTRSRCRAHRGRCPACVCWT